MKLPLPFLISVLGLFVTLAPAAPTAETDERVAAAYVLALGRTATPAELSQRTASGSDTISALVTRLRETLARDPAATGATSRKAFTDAFGRAPNAGEAVGTGTYTELLQGHVRSLTEHPDDYAGVLGRAYRFVISRDVYPEEIEYWKKQDPLPYALLVACIEDWARRNQPGLMVTAGTATASINSLYLTTVRLSPTLAAEARAAAGLAPVVEGEASTPLGRNVIAAGAGKIASSGRIYFVAAGSPELAR